MADFNFYVDEVNLAKIAANMEADPGLFNSIVETMEYVTTQKGISCLYCFEDFYSVQVEGIPIAQTVFKNLSDGDFRDLLVRLQIVISESEATRVDDEAATGEAAIRARDAGGWISTETPTAKDWWSPEKMAWTPTNEKITAAIRFLFVNFNLSCAQLDQFAAYLFPNIYFHVLPSAIRNTSLNYRGILALYVKHLAYLNDFVRQDFERYHQPNAIIANAGGRGVDMSPESPITHKNKDAMKERQIEIGGVSICCEWHTKLDNTRGRVHFFPWKHQDAAVFRIAGDRVIVGIIAEHLT